jgi:hypothetical protein
LHCTEGSDSECDQGTDPGQKGFICHQNEAECGCKLRGALVLAHSNIPYSKQLQITKVELLLLLLLKKVTIRVINRSLLFSSRYAPIKGTLKDFPEGTEGEITFQGIMMAASRTIVNITVSTE